MKKGRTNLPFCLASGKTDGTRTRLASGEMTDRYSNQTGQSTHIRVFNRVKLMM